MRRAASGTRSQIARALIVGRLWLGTNYREITLRKQTIFSAWFKSGLQLRSGWGRRPKGNAPRFEASALGARWLLPARSQPPNYRHLRGWQSGSSRPTPQGRWGPITFPGRQKGVTLPLLVISGLATHGDGLRFLSTR